VLVAAMVASAAGFGAQELVNPSGPAVAAASGGATLLSTGTGVVWASVADDIFRSTDGGVHWKAVLPPAANPATCGCFYYSYFFGSQHAWAEESLNSANSSGGRLWSTADGGRRWKLGPRLPLPSPWQSLDLGGIGYTFDFTSASDGYLVASSSDLTSKLELLSAVWRTRDGGHSWKAVGGTRAPLNGTVVSDNSSCQAAGFLAATFVNATTGWIANPCGQGPAMWETFDGGSTWRPSKLATPPGGWERGFVPMAAPPVVTASGAVIDEVTVGNGTVVVEETRAGSWWRYLGRLRTAAIGLPATLDVIDATHFALPASDGMWVSDDAAKTWHLVSSGIDLADLGPMSLLLGRSQELAGIVLAESSDSGTDADAAAVALRTTDGGASWQPVGSTLSLDPYGGEAPYDLLDFSNAGTGYVAGDGGLAVTKDGGKTWRLELGEAEPIDELEVDGPTDAVVLGSDSLLTTSDGGLQWRRESEPAAGGLAGVSFVNADVGFGVVCEPSPADRDYWQVPENVELVRTTDGGRSWHTVSLPPYFGCPAPISNGQGAASEQFSQLCVASGQILYAIAGPPGYRNGWMVPQGTFLFRSADAGRSWHRIARTTGDGIDSCQGDRLWTVAQQGNQWGSVEVSSFSSDEGRHFSSRVGATFGISTYADIGLRGAVITRAAGTIAGIETPSSSSAVLFEWRGTSSKPARMKLQTTSDSGLRWSTPSTATPIDDIDFTAFFLSTRSGFTLGQTTPNSSETLLFATSDGGRSWQRLTQFPQLR
jgi:photosystem II stability/assembly factor-like uncharacterized protein